LVLFLVGIFFLTQSAVRPNLAAGLQDKKAEKAEQERKKQEEEEAKRAAKEKDEAKQLMDEVQPELDAFGAQLRQNLYPDQFLQDYVNQMGQSLVPKEVPPGVLFAFRVVNNPIPNAFALPDGRIYVHTGLLVFVQNEAQLAVVLGHEIGHVTQHHYIEAAKESRSFKKAVLPGILGAGIGAAIGAATNGKQGAAVGAVAGGVGAAVVSEVLMNSYSRRQEDEADRIGVRLALDRKFDAKESIPFFQKLTDQFGDQDKFSNALWGNHSRNAERIKNIQALLDGDLAPIINSLKTSGELSQGSGQMLLYTSRMYRDVALSYMNDYDRYDVPKRLLDYIIDYRGHDPVALAAIGRVYKVTGRTDADRAKALDYLQRAVQADQRGLYPYIHRELGLMQASLGSNQVQAATESLKKYIVDYVTRNNAYPPDLLEMYDYLLTFGDGTWEAPKLERAIVAPVAPGRAPSTASNQAPAGNPPGGVQSFIQTDQPGTTPPNAAGAGAKPPLPPLPGQTGQRGQRGQAAPRNPAQPGQRD
jgi:Zn-dependent protease with chaperone function